MIATSTDDSAAIAGVNGLVIVLTGLLALVLSRPSDLAPYEPR